MKMTVGIDLWNIRQGGCLTHISELLSAADPVRDGFQTIVVWSRSATLEALPHRPWLVKVHVPSLEGNTLSSFLWHARYTDTEARRHGCSILLVPGTIHVGRFRPYVTIPQNLLPFSPRECARYGWGRMRFRLLMLRWLHTLTIKWSSGVIYLTNGSKTWIEDRVGSTPAKKVVIPHGIAPRFRHDPASRNEPPIGSDRPFRWIYVSTIDHYKHQIEVAEAVRALRDSGFPATVEFIGPARDYAWPRLRETLERIDPRSEFSRYSGPANFNLIERKYHQADGFVLASSCESISLVLLEAMASGLPIACSRCEPLPEVLRDGGLFFDPDSPVEIAATLRRLQTDPLLRARLAKRASELASTYSWDRCAEETFAFLRACLPRAAERAMA